MYKCIFAAVLALAGAGLCHADDLAPITSPTVSVEFDGSHHVDVCHKGKQSQVAVQSDAKEEVSFEKKSDFDPFSIGVCALAGVLGAGFAVYTSVKQEASK